MNRRPSTLLGPLAVAGLLVLGLILSSVALADESKPREWTKKSFDVQGSWTLIEEDGVRFLVLSEDFKTKNAPDLKLFLSKRTVTDANNRNATQNAVLIAELRNNKGGQRYRLPADLDVDAFSSLLLHCERYSKLWAAAPLEASSSPP